MIAYIAPPVLNVQAVGAFPELGLEKETADDASRCPPDLPIARLTELSAVGCGRAVVVEHGLLKDRRQLVIRVDGCFQSRRHLM